VGIKQDIPRRKTKMATKKSPTNATATTTKPRTVTKRKAASVVESVANLKPEQIMGEVGALSVSLQSQLAGIGTAITNKLEALHDLDSAIADKSAELAELFEIEKEAQNLESVREMRAREDEEWEKTKANRLSEWADDEAAREKKFTRENEAHAYEFAQKVARDKEQFEAQKAERMRIENIRRQDLERDWNAREEALKTRENELSSLRERITQFEEELKREVAKTEAMTTQRLKRDYEHQIALANKDAEAAAKLAAANEKALRDQVSSLSEQLEAAHKDLDEARKDAKEVTSAALQSASGRDSLAAVQNAVANVSSKK
jgi:colicin import membrane protein